MAINGQGFREIFAILKRQLLKLKISSDLYDNYQTFTHVFDLNFYLQKLLTELQNRSWSLNRILSLN